jgi:hypothetical protein
MKTHIGTKLVKLLPMTRAEYNEYRGWKLPGNENGLDEGYLVEYADGGKPNDPRHDGYISWSPKEEADAAYRPADGMSFCLAMEALKKGLKVARAGWNGKGMFVYLVPGSQFKVNRAPLLGIYPEGEEITYRPHMNLKAADGSVAAWSPSGSDALADDWLIVE